MVGSSQPPENLTRPLQAGRGILYSTGNTINSQIVSKGNIVVGITIQLANLYPACNMIIQTDDNVNISRNSRKAEEGLQHGSMTDYLDEAVGAPDYLDVNSTFPTDYLDEARGCLGLYISPRTVCVCRAEKCTRGAGGMK